MLRPDLQQEVLGSHDEGRHGCDVAERLDVELHARLLVLLLMRGSAPKVGDHGGRA